MTREQHETGGRKPRVRPRLVWGGTAAAVAGMVAVALGMVLDRTGLTVAGAALVLLALAVAWRGGIMYDVHTRGSGEDVGSVVAGERHEGVVPGEEIDDETAERRAAGLAEQKRADLRGSEREGHSPTAPLGAYLLVVLAVWLLIGQWLLGYRYTDPGQNAALRDQGFAVVVGLAGIRLAVAPHSRPATLVGLLAGILLVLAGALLPHSTTQAAANEVVTGVLVIIAGALTWPAGRR
jgi:hypothetical protein